MTAIFAFRGIRFAHTKALASFSRSEQGLIAAAASVIQSAMHIVDELIYERAPKLVVSPVWPVAKPMLYGILGYRKAVAMADAIRDLGGPEALDYISKLLLLKVAVQGLDNLPATGRCVVVCNHPTGIADGIAVADAIARVRRDAIFFANADALRVNGRFNEALIPVEWVAAKRTHAKTKDTLRAAQAAFEAERCVVIFPAGRLARRDAEGRLVDPAWAPTAVSLAQRHKAPIVPMHLAGPNAFWFHLFNRFSSELRDITLFHEFLNKAGKRFDLVVGAAIDPETVETVGLKTYIERRLTSPEAVFTP